jgi:hypothetical protein
MLLTRIKKLLGTEKEILLSVPDTYPTWHSRYGEDTHFASKIKGVLLPCKIHALKSGVTFWESACRKLATGNYSLRIVYLEDRPQGKIYCPITKGKTLHTQRARYDQCGRQLLLEGRPAHPAARATPALMKKRKNGIKRWNCTERKKTGNRPLRMARACCLRELFSAATFT